MNTYLFLDIQDYLYRNKILDLKWLIKFGLLNGRVVFNYKVLAEQVASLTVKVAKEVRREIAIFYQV